ncbi:MAG TPA: hypothetical protein VIK91_17110 [Nannocystis sp.]
MAAVAPEQDAVIARVEAQFAGRDPAAAANLLAFGEAVRRTVAVINVSASWAVSFLKSDKLLYASYAPLVAAGARLPARFADDRQRRTVESALFGTYGEEMRYAALSLDGTGLVSYGPVTMVLRERAIAHRASVLEENSYDFSRRHRILANEPIPRGYRAPWATRHQLAMAKCGADVDATTTEVHYPQLVLWSDGDRATDRFMEVSIFGPFNRRAVERIVLPAKPPRGVTRTELNLVRAAAQTLDPPVTVEVV